MIKAAKISLVATSIILHTAFSYAANSAPKVGTIIPPVGSSQADTTVYFTTTYADPNGRRDISSVYFLINTTASTSKSFCARYSCLANKLYLINDTGTAWLGGYSPGSPKIIENSYAKLDCSKVTVLGFGNTLSVRWPLAPKSSFTGTKNMYLYAIDKKSAATGWVQKGTWTIKDAALVKINDVSDSPDPFSPNGDGYKDTTTILATVSTSGFHRRLPLIWKITISDSRGNIIKRFIHIESAPINSSIKISQVWNGTDDRNIKVKDGKYTYRIDARIYNVIAMPASGDVTVKSSPQLSVAVSPDYWNIGEVKADSVITMAELNKITVTNESNCSVNYSLCLVNPAGWSDSQESIGNDTYVLNAAFSSKSENISWNEADHALSEVPVKSTSTKFAGDMTGINVMPEEKRSLWLQFKAPKTTSVTNEQNIEVIVNAQAS